MGKPFLIGISGGSGAGKSTVVELIRRQCQGRSITVISQDHYYRDQSHLSQGDRGAVNFDHPDALDLDLMAEHAHALLRGEVMHQPKYDFVTHTRSQLTVEVVPEDIMIFDGIFSLYHEELRRLLNLKIYLDVPADLRLVRRIERDTRDRGRDCRSVISQYIATVRPMHLLFVEPTKSFADIVLPWERQNNDLIRDIVDRIGDSKMIQSRKHQL
jgi:uridine kinase